jgi:hypothetical protein
MDDLVSGGSDDDGTEEENEEAQEEAEKIAYKDLFKVKVVDGVKQMAVVCPYCGNIETITL